jgi:predicted RNase H-like HicB family nuclease
MKFKVALYPSEEGYSVNAPGLPGCWSQGATEEEALANITEAIREYLETEIDAAEGAIIREVEVIVPPVGRATVPSPSL